MTKPNEQPTPVDVRRDSGEPPTPLSGSRVRARLSVSLLYVVMGMTIGNWGSRVPDIRSAVGLGDTGWGLTSLGGSTAQWIGLGIVVVLITRVSTRRLSLIGAWIVVVNAPLMAASSTVPALVSGLFVWSIGASLMATPMQAQAIEVERQYGRPLQSTISAWFTLGMFAGGGLGIIAAHLKMSPGLQLGISSAVLGVLLVIGGRWLPKGKAKETDGARKTRRRIRDRFTPRLCLLATMGALSGLAAGTSAWIAIYVSDELDGGGVLGAAAFTSTSIATALGLLVGDRIARRIGRLRFFRLSCLVAATGLCLAILASTPLMAAIGFVIFGLGGACINPTLFGLAGEESGVDPGESSSVIEVGQAPGEFAAPLLIGSVGGLFGLSSALVFIAASTLAIALLSLRVKDANTKHTIASA